MYFKNHHGSEGHIFESQFKASRISNESYLLHISRYIHLNPRNFEEWQHSSYQYYTCQQESSPDWLEMQSMRELFSKTNYRMFCQEYVPIMIMLKQTRNDPLEVGQSM
jgi:hypothetical protein